MPLLNAINSLGEKLNTRTTNAFGNRYLYDCLNDSIPTVFIITSFFYFKITYSLEVVSAGEVLLSRVIPRFQVCCELF